MDNEKYNKTKANDLMYISENNESVEYEISQEEREEARKMFLGECEFVAGAMYEHQLPAPTLSEIAFAGRSNVGKSSIINALLSRKKLVRISSNPGHTRQVNIFDLSGKINLVDLPGYGYARASKQDMYRWQGLILDYLKGRPSLVRVMLLIDARRGLKEQDLEVMDMLDKIGLSYQLILTKIDKIKQSELDIVSRKVEAESIKHGACYPFIGKTSSIKDIGLEQLRISIYRLYKSFG